ncbi:hypothetical protein [Deinococcus radiotolerans]|uniref:Uncharacterized protein n=1 Tax=Deinococcus radiotolerans TaxID=1309407 RepID=A0ABQ2FFC7_9DEIO|nr:hypothetical protein [Deinococcus radiotolerans]GGK90676.1 hypothetical protein GCM10010844_06530 [Deinococcus radiotolerans]
MNRDDDVPPPPGPPAKPEASSPNGQRAGQERNAKVQQKGMKEQLKVGHAVMVLIGPTSCRPSFS